MHTFMGNEMRYLEIIAVNARDSHMFSFLDRTIVSRLSGEARLAALIILKRDKEVRCFAQFFTADVVQEIQVFCEMLCIKVADEMDALEARSRNRAHVLSAVA